MSLLDAAYVVLVEAKEPLHYRVITERILERDPQATRAKKPWEVVGRDIREDIRKDPVASRFRKDGPGVFGLNETPTNRSLAAPQQVQAATSPEAGASMSFLDAAERVLKEAGTGSALDYKEITRRAIAQGFLDSKGQTPEVTLSARVGDDIRQREARGEPPKFVRPARGLIALAEALPPQIAGQIEKHNHEVREQLRSRLQSAASDTSEDQVAELLAAMGFQEVERTPLSGDGGIDVYGNLVVGGVLRIRLAVQVKCWGKNVQRPEIQRFRGSLVKRNISQGLIVTTSDFSPGAEEEAADASPLVSLMNGERLLDLLIQHRIGVSAATYTLLQLLDAEAEDNLQ